MRYLSFDPNSLSGGWGLADHRAERGLAFSTRELVLLRRLRVPGLGRKFRREYRRSKKNLFSRQVTNMYPVMKIALGPVESLTVI